MFPPKGREGFKTHTLLKAQCREKKNRANIYLGQKNVATNLSAIQLPEMFKEQKK